MPYVEKLSGSARARAERIAESVSVAGTSHPLVISTRIILGQTISPLRPPLPRYYPATSELSTAVVTVSRKHACLTCKGHCHGSDHAGRDRFATEASRQEYRGLEAGDILYFPTSPPLVTAEERTFLVTQRQIDGSLYKNISYRPSEDRLRGVDQEDAAQLKRVHEIMRAFSSRSIAFMASFLKRYASAWKIDYASFRPIEESRPQGFLAFTQ